ncbi:Hypothetical predicted protein [Xyrichtys novacula]|uniref:Uncharacterized protein n=1 Tax=Xyrichtys novacula TaxID=13765 RepID=A0AAV1FP73_XYRNO|nr:Hypothetical predicted protein [Xyrichtys novacula]
MFEKQPVSIFRKRRSHKLACGVISPPNSSKQTQEVTQWVASMGTREETPLRCTAPCVGRPGPSCQCLYESVSALVLTAVMPQRSDEREGDSESALSRGNLAEARRQTSAGQLSVKPPNCHGEVSLSRLSHPAISPPPPLSHPENSQNLHPQSVQTDTHFAPLP